MGISKPKMMDSESYEMPSKRRTSTTPATPASPPPAAPTATITTPVISTSDDSGGEGEKKKSRVFRVMVTPGHHASTEENEAHTDTEKAAYEQVVKKVNGTHIL